MLAYDYGTKSVIIQYVLLHLTAVTVSLSVRNDGNVSESNAAMLVLVTLEGYLETYVTVTVQTSDGTGTCTYVHAWSQRKEFSLFSDMLLIGCLCF